MKIKWHPVVIPTRLAVKHERLDKTIFFTRNNVIAFHIDDETEQLTYMDVNGFTYKSRHNYTTNSEREYGFAEVLINGEWTE